MTLLDDLKEMEPERLRKIRVKELEEKHRKLTEENKIINQHRKVINDIFNKHDYDIEFIVAKGTTYDCDGKIESTTIFKVDELQFQLKLKKLIMF